MWVLVQHPRKVGLCIGVTSVWVQGHAPSLSNLDAEERHNEGRWSRAIDGETIREKRERKEGGRRIL